MVKVADTEFLLFHAILDRSSVDFVCSWVPHRPAPVINLQGLRYFADAFVVTFKVPFDLLVIG